MVAEFESDLIRLRTKEGMRVAKTKGRLQGRQPKLNARQEAHLAALHRAGEHSTAELRRMPAEEIGDPNTRFAVVIPTGAEAAALRVPRRVRDVLRIDVYAVSDDGQVERLAV